MKIKKILFVAPYDPEDIQYWSGILYYLYSALKKNNKGIIIEPIKPGLLGNAAWLLQRIFWRFRIRIDVRSSKLYAILKGIELTRRFLFIRGAVVLAVIASNEIAYLRTNKKIIYLSDATFDAIYRLYGYAFPRWLQHQCEQNQKRALQKARYSIFSSEWAAESARTHYGVRPEQIFELPFGPNIPEQAINRDVPAKTLSSGSEIMFLFVSNEWKRKNGDKAVEICRFLREVGVKARLVTVGNTAPYAKDLDFVEDLGFLRKSEPEQLDRLCKAYRDAHFFLLPSTADATPIVFAEAQAFGVPPIACDVGGVGSSIQDKQTGLLLAPDAPSEEFVEVILPYIRNPQLYGELSRNCRAWHVEKANWAKWADLIISLACRDDSLKSDVVETQKVQTIEPA